MHCALVAPEGLDEFLDPTLPLDLPLVGIMSGHENDVVTHGFYSTFAEQIGIGATFGVSSSGELIRDGGEGGREGEMVGRGW